MFKTLPLGFSGPGQAADGAMLTISTPKGAITESCLSGGRLEAPLTKTLADEIDG